VVLWDTLPYTLEGRKKLRVWQSSGSARSSFLEGRLSLDCIVGIVNRLGFRQSRVRFSAEPKVIFSSLKRQDLMWDPTNLLLCGYPRQSGPGVMLTTHVHLVPLYSSFTASWHAQRQLNVLSKDVSFVSLYRFILIKKFLLFDVLFCI